MFLNCDWIIDVADKDFLLFLQEILHSYGDTISTVGIISTVFGYLDRKPVGKEQGELAPEKLEGRIVFQNVTFSYPSASADKTALKVTGNGLTLI